MASESLETGLKPPLTAALSSSKSPRRCPNTGISLESRCLGKTGLLGT
ncbi:MAG: hypothetical protein MUC60_10140 [Oscillatoria sp. Prado101]|nr:hypothetical protein [Oscillatoria sp. Prado101]